MKVKDLRKIIATMDDNAIVVVSDISDCVINLVDAYDGEDILYLNSVQEFPSEWYDEDSLEIGYDYTANYGYGRD